MEIIIETDFNTLSQDAAELIIERIKLILTEKDYVVLGLVGGRSVGGIFKAWLSSNEDFWKKVHIFQLDERLTTFDDPESNFNLLNNVFAKEHILRGILPVENVHPYIIDKEKGDYGLSDYYAELEKYGGKYDIVLLSSGEDGHVGALYPEHKVLSIPGKKFVAMEDGPKPPPQRMTASIELLSSTPFVVLLFIGEGKRDALNAFNDPKKGIIDCPAKLVLWMKEAVVYTDLEDE